MQNKKQEKIGQRHQGAVAEKKWIPANDREMKLIFRVLSGNQIRLCTGLIKEFYALLFTVYSKVMPIF